MNILTLSLSIHIHLNWQLDENLSHDEGKEAEIKEAFVEFYKLLDDYEIIDKSVYTNINDWFEEEMETAAVEA